MSVKTIKKKKNRVLIFYSYLSGLNDGNALGVGKCSDYN